jgi:hypothetical protein
MLVDDFTREVKRSLCTEQPMYLNPPKIRSSKGRIRRGEPLGLQLGCDIRLILRRD